MPDGWGIVRNRAICSTFNVAERRFGFAMGIIMMLAMVMPVGGTDASEAKDRNVDAVNLSDAVALLAKRQQADGSFGSLASAKSMLTFLSDLALRLSRANPGTALSMPSVRAHEWLRGRICSANQNVYALTDEDRLMYAWMSLELYFSTGRNEWFNESKIAVQLLLDSHLDNVSVLKESGSVLDRSELCGLGILVSDMAKLAFPGGTNITEFQNCLIKQAIQRFGVNTQLPEVTNNWATTMSLATYMLLPETNRVNFSDYRRLGGTEEWPIEGERWPLLRAFLENLRIMQSTGTSTDPLNIKARIPSLQNEVRKAKELSSLGIRSKSSSATREPWLSAFDSELYSAALYILLQSPIRVSPIIPCRSDSGGLNPSSMRPSDSNHSDDVFVDVDEK